MRNTLEKALELIFGHEGGYVNAKSDRGGPTKFGITARTLGNWRKLGRSATIDEVKGLSITEATAIVEEQYGKPIRYDDLPAGVDYCLLDFAVNSGPAQAVKSTQKALGLPTQDGVMGVNTLSAIKANGKDKVIEAICTERMRFLKKLGGAQGWRANGRGWSIRVTGLDPLGKYAPQKGVIGNALQMATGLTSSTYSPTIAPDESMQPARGTQQTLRSTTQGKGAVASLVGLATTQVGAAKDAIQPLVGSGGVIDHVFTYLTVAGVLIGISGAVAVGWGVYKRIASGAPA